MADELAQQPGSEYAKQQKLMGVVVPTLIGFDANGGNWPEIAATIKTATDDDASPEVRNHAASVLARFAAGEAVLRKRWTWHDWSRRPIFRTTQRLRARRVRRTSRRGSSSGQRGPPREDDGERSDLAPPLRGAS